MQQVLNEKQTLKDEVRQRMELIAELEQAKVQLTDQCRRYEAEISAGKDRHDLLTQEKQVLEETVSRNKKQLNQNEISKQQLQKNVTEKSVVVESHEKTIREHVQRIETEVNNYNSLNEEKTKTMEEKRELQRNLDDSQRQLANVTKSHDALSGRYEKVEKQENMGVAKIRQLEKELQKLERELKNMLGKNNGLEV
jgi:chromosome segregation ATPase